MLFHNRCIAVNMTNGIWCAFAFTHINFSVTDKLRTNPYNNALAIQSLQCSNVELSIKTRLLVFFEFLHKSSFTQQKFV